MNTFQLLLTIFTLHLLAVSSPGPDFFLVLKNSMQYGKRVGVYLSLGIALGIAVHILYSLTGVALLLKYNPKVFNFIKILGALYIIYIGIKSIVQKHLPKQNDNSPNKQLHNSTTPQIQNYANQQAIKTGFIVNVLNPKASLFFLSIFSVVIPENTQILVYVIIVFMMLLTNFLWFYLVAIFFTRPYIMSLYKKYEFILVKVFGVLLILLGIEIFFYH